MQTALTLAEIDAMDDTMHAEPMPAARIAPLPVGAVASRAVSCSQCGNEFFGLHGYSACIQHRLHIRPAHKAPQITPGLHYETYRSECLGADLRVGLELEDRSDDTQWQFGPFLAGAELCEVWVGDCDLAQHLTQISLDLITAESCRHIANLIK